jgi:hypothetical protein
LRFLKRKYTVDWSKISSIPAYAPAFELFPSAVHIEGTLYQLDETSYFLASDLNHKLEPTPGGPFIMSLLWAVDQGAARRAALNQIELDTCHIVVLPPSWLLPDQSKPTYGSIRQGVIDSGASGFLETADYRIATDGAFIHRSISSRGREYFFRTTDGDEEHPYAIRVRLARK